MFDLICLDLIHAWTEHSVRTEEKEKEVSLHGFIRVFGFLGIWLLSVQFCVRVRGHHFVS